MTNANTPFSALPTVLALTGTEIVPLDQAGTTKTATVAQIVGTFSSGSAVLNSSNIWINGQYFKSGSPWADVKAFGALGNGTGDDSVAFNAAVTQLTNGGIVYLPPGTYNIANNVSDQGRRIRFVGAGRGAVHINATVDIIVFTLTGRGSQIEHCSISGFNNISTANAAISLNGIETQIIDCDIANGKYAIDVGTGGADSVMDRVVCVSGTYGPAYIHTQAVCYLRRCKLDGPGYPTTIAPAFGTTFSNWTNGHVYTANTIVNLAASNILVQCTVGGTSGGVEPVAVSYGTNIVDNTATWRIVAPLVYSGLLIDGGTSVLSAEMCDFSGQYSAAVRIAVTNALAAPATIVLGDCDYSAFKYGVWANCAGNYLRITDTENFSGFTDPASAGVQIESAWLGDTYINNNVIIGAKTGVQVNGGRNTDVSNNGIFGSGISGSIGVHVAAGISNFRVRNNDFTSTVWGTNDNGIVIDSGVSDFYSIEGNNVNGVSSAAITDGGSGQHKLVWGQTTQFIGNTSSASGFDVDYNFNSASSTPPVTGGGGSRIVSSDGLSGGFGYSALAIGNLSNFVGNRINGTLAAPTVVSAGNVVFREGGGGWNGSAIIQNRARIDYIAAENYSSIANGTYIALATTSTGSVAAAIKCTVLPSGGITVGSSAMPDPGAGSLAATNAIFTTQGGLAIASLPASSASQGARAFTIDSSLTFVSSNMGLSLTSGGGANKVPVFSDGSSSWKLG